MKQSKKYIRAKDIEEIYGIKPGRLYGLFEQGLKSTLLKGRGNKRGTRLVKVVDLEKFLNEREVEVT